MKSMHDESAFPITNTSSEADMRGMSLRDWFAGMAMQGLLSSEDKEDIAVYECVAEMAYRQADAMMEARKALG